MAFRSMRKCKADYCGSCRRDWVELVLSDVAGFEIDDGRAILPMVLSRLSSPCRSCAAACNMGKSTWSISIC
jgi:hypothetical protein